MPKNFYKKGLAWGFTPTPTLIGGESKKNSYASKLVWGFTLLELMVVIAIIGILSAIVLVSLNTARIKARDVRRVTDIKQIQEALELYYDSGVGSGAGYVGASYPAVSIYNDNVLKPTYIPVMPRDPLTLANYKYIPINSSSSITLCSGATTACLYYHLAAVLEQKGSGADGTGGNAALANDSDLDSSAITGPPAGFKGKTPDCGTGTVLDDSCFDVSP